MKTITRFLKVSRDYFFILLIFLGLSAVYFSPALNGYTLVQGDIANWKAAAKELTDFRELYSEESVWTNSMFGGMPGYFISVYYLNGLTWIQEVLSLGLPFTMLPISMIFIAMLSFFILGKSLKATNLIAVLGAIAYGFVSYHLLIIEAGHNTKTLALAYIPAVLGAFIMIYKNKNSWFPAGIFAIFMGLELRANHIQMTYYFAFILFILGAFYFYEAIKTKAVADFLKRTLIIIAGATLALLANFNSFYNAAVYSKYTMRGTPELTINPDGSDKKSTLSSGLDRDYIVQWCYGKQETYNLLVPNAKGDSKNLTGEYFDYLRENNPQLFNYSAEQYQKNQGKIFGGYWGDQPFTSGANYLGAIIVLLALLYIIFVKSTLKWALLMASILAIMLSWGKNLGGSVENMWFTNFFIDYIPMYSKFRTVSSILVIVNLIFPLMAMLFVNHVYQNLDWAKSNLKKIMIASGSVASIVLVFAFVPSFFDFTSDIEDNIFNQLYQTYNQTKSGVNPADAEEALIDFRIDAFRNDSYRTLLFLALTISILFLWITKKIKYNYAIIGLIALALIDVWGVNKRYLNNDKNPQNKREYLSWEKVTGYENTFTANPGDKEIYNIETSKNPQIEQIALQRLQEKKKEKGRLTFMDEESVRFATLNLNTNYRVMNLDNPFNSAAVSYLHKSSGGYHAAKMARYQDMIDFYISKELSMLQTPEQTKVLNMLNTKYYLYQGNLVLHNPFAYGNAWFANEIKTVKNPNEEILAVAEINTKVTCVVDEKFSTVLANKNFKSDSTSTIELSSYLPNKLTYQSKSASEQLAVFSEIYYKDGWNAYIDGKPVDHLRANYILRALPIPVGEHQIEFKFEPRMIGIGNAIGLVAFLLIVAIFGYGIYSEVKYSTEVTK